MLSTAEKYLNENIFDDDYNKLEETINDFLCTNNVLKYMEGYARFYHEQISLTLNKELNNLKT